MPEEVVVVGPEHPVYSFNRDHEPRAHVQPETLVRFHTSDAAYRVLTGADLDAGRIPTRLLNALAGPVFVDGAEPGDALGATVESIEIGDRAFAVYVARWRQGTFGIARSSVASYPVGQGFVDLGNGARIAVRPMIGCAGVAPAVGELSSLSPTGATGGNMDLLELTPGATLWLPVRVAGGLFALGDLHAAMGRGEATGAGLECGGTVAVRFTVAKRRPLPGPRVETADRIFFVGTDPAGFDGAQRRAITAAWEWLTVEKQVEPTRAVTLCSALLDVDLGGPAGSNVIAGFDLRRLKTAGIDR